MTQPRFRQRINLDVAVPELLAGRTVRLTAAEVGQDGVSVRYEVRPLIPPGVGPPRADRDWYLTARDDVGTAYLSAGGARGPARDGDYTSGVESVSPGPPPDASWIELLFFPEVDPEPSPPRHELRLDLPVLGEPVSPTARRTTAIAAPPLSSLLPGHTREIDIVIAELMPGRAIRVKAVSVDEAAVSLLIEISPALPTGEAVDTQRDLTPKLRARDSLGNHYGDMTQGVFQTARGSEVTHGILAVAPGPPREAAWLDLLLCTPDDPLCRNPERVVRVYLAEGRVHDVREERE